MMILLAKRETGGEEVEFKSGDNSKDPYKFDEKVSEMLNKNWSKLPIALRRQNLSSVIGAFVGGFCWVIDSKANPGSVIFYIDNLQFE